MIRKRKIYHKKFYIILGFSIALLVSLIYFAINIYQVEYIIEKNESLSFKSSVELTRWHDEEAKYVYITFDDGPTENAPKILDVLKEYDVSATFFVLGSTINNNGQSKEILNRMVEENHYIGLHSMTHDKNTLYGAHGPENFVREMEELQSVISSLIAGYESELCRAPYGTGGGTFTAKHVTAIQRANIKCWDWDVDSLDWKYSQDPATVFQIVQKQTQMQLSKNDLIVLFHEKDSTVAVLPKVIEYYQDLGYEFANYSIGNSVERMFFKIK